MKKVLCLHGRRQSGSTFASKLFGSVICNSENTTTTRLQFPLKKLLNNNNNNNTVESNEIIEFIFPNGPLVASSNIPAHSRAIENKCTMFSWWSDNLSDVEQGIEAAIESTPDAVAICGFSQGGAMGALICLQHRLPSLRAAIFLSSYVPKLSSLPPSFNTNTKSPTIPSLHVFGLTDQVVRPVLSEKLHSDFGPLAQICPLQNHGHAIPTPPFGEQVLLPWLNEQLSI
jgi:predicted esterase